MRAKIVWHAIWMRVSSNRDGTYRQSWDEFASLTKVPFIWCQCGFGAAPIWSCFGSGSFARVSQRDTLCRDYLERFQPLDWRLGSGWQNWTCFGKTPLCAKSCASPWRCDAPTAVEALVRLCDPPELRPRRAVLWRWLEERRPCRACAVSLPCTCSSTTPSAGPNGLKAGWLISRYKPVKIFLTKTLLLWLKVKHHLFIPPFSFPGRDSDAPVLPYFWLLFGSLLWASIAYSGIKIWAKRTKTFAEFQRLFLISSTSRLTNDPLSDLWPLRAPPIEFPSKYFYKARLGEWDSPILQTILPGLPNLKYAWVVYGICLHLSAHIFLRQLVFCLFTCWATFYAFLSSIGASSVMEIFCFLRSYAIT